MKVLMVNKFLYPNGGSETYVFKLGSYLSSHGHDVQYFGMEHEGRIVGNAVNAYSTDMDFHGGSYLSKLTYPLKTINNTEAAKKIRAVLEDFKPDAVHLNNFNYQLTPSIIVEVVAWRKKTRRKCRIIYTAHDGQFVCPNHMLYNPNSKAVCEQCLGGHFINCTKGKCIHGSAAKSIIGTIEAIYWRIRGTYKYIDTIICPSEYMKKKLDTNPILSDKTLVLCNFIDKDNKKTEKKKDYVLYFGAFTEEKGVATLMKVCKMLPDIQFVFAGAGALEAQINTLQNVDNVGFKSGEELKNLIGEARFSICPSELNENCPFSVLESQELGTPVVGSNVGGIPELINDGVDGRLFEAKDSTSLRSIIEELWHDPETVEQYRKKCLSLQRYGIEEYYDNLIQVYDGKNIDKSNS